MSPVELTPETRPKLEQLWRAAADAVADAADALNSRIGAEPKTGESRAASNERIAFEPPSAVIFREPGPDGVVRVTDVSRF